MEQKTGSNVIISRTLSYDSFFLHLSHEQYILFCLMPSFRCGDRPCLLQGGGDTMGIALRAQKSSSFHFLNFHKDTSFKEKKK